MLAGHGWQAHGWQAMAGARINGWEETCPVGSAYAEDLDGEQ
jgi:hypothetical protein